MSDAMTPAPEVFRGMQVLAAPMRLRLRAAPVAAPGTGAASTEACAEQERRSVLEAAAHEGFRQGLREGTEEGLRQGRAAAEEETRQALAQAVAKETGALRAQHERLGQLAEALRAAHGQALEAAHEEMIALCFETICRIVGASAVREETVHAHLLHLLRAHGSAAEVVLHVHPQDAEVLERLDGDADPALRWVADPQVRLGGCILRTAAGGLDARLETMLEECRSALLDARQRRALSCSAPGGEA